MKRNITMAKKKKSHKPKKRPTRPKQTAPKSKKRFKFPLFAMIAGGVLVLAGAYFLYQGKKPPARSPQLTELKKEHIRLREKRPTLPPTLFSGNTRRAYEIAREIPEVLNRLYCYCRCRENFSHISLLSCFVDKHAST